MKRIWLLIGLILLVLCGTGMAEEEDPTVVQVGKVSYPLSLARYSIRSGEMMNVLGFIKEETGHSRVDSTLETLINMGVLENQLIKAGKHDLTNDEQVIVENYAANVYDQLWRELQKQLEEAGYDATEEEITQWLKQDLACTQSVVYQEVLAQEWRQRGIELYCKDVTITTQEVVEFLEEYYIKPDREAYENDIERYEQEILSTGSESFFVPEGYRRIRQILLPFPESINRKIMEKQPELNLITAEIAEIREKMADAVIEGKETDSLLSEYQGKKDKLDDLEKQVREIQKSALESLKTTTDAIYLRLETGTDFLTLMSEYGGEDQSFETLEMGLEFHPRSKSWDERFRAAAASLQSPGDVSQPVVTDLGIHIIQYVEDIPGGIHILTGEEQEALQNTALQQKQMVRLSELVAEWRKDYQVETHPELLDEFL